MLTKPHVACQVTAVRGAQGVPLSWASAISELREGRLGPALNAQLAASPHARRSLSKRARATRRLTGLDRTAPAPATHAATPRRTPPPHHRTVLWATGGLLLGDASDQPRDRRHHALRLRHRRRPRPRARRARPRPLRRAARAVRGGGGGAQPRRPNRNPNPNRNRNPNPNPSPSPNTWLVP
jgi:hypothetical protein